MTLTNLLIITFFVVFGQLTSCVSMGVFVTDPPPEYKIAKKERPR